MTLPENHELLASIIAKPEDDALRLIYADWLEENDALDRAEFIRVQCSLHDKLASDPDYVDLLERQEEVITRLMAAVSLPTVEVPAGFKFHQLLQVPMGVPVSYERGFPSNCGTLPGLDPKITQDSFRELITTTTIRGLLISGEKVFKAIAQCTESQQIQFAYLQNLETCAFPELPSTWLARSLKRLWLVTLTDESKAADFLRADFRSLKEFHIGYLTCPARIAEEMTEQAWFRNLHKFFALLPDMATALPFIEGLSRLPYLHTLTLGHLPEGGADVLTKNDFSRLKSLRLQFRNLTAQCFAAIANSNMANLVELELDGGQVTSETVRNLSLTDVFQKLSILNLADNVMDDQGIESLTQSPFAPQLRILRLGNNRFGLSGLLKLAKGFPNLTTLTINGMRCSGIAEGDLTRFLTELEMPQLRHLHLWDSPLTDLGAHALGNNKSLSNLVSLLIDSDGLSEKRQQELLARYKGRLYLKAHSKDRL